MLRGSSSTNPTADFVSSKRLQTRDLPERWLRFFRAQPNLRKRTSSGLHSKKTINSEKSGRGQQKHPSSTPASRSFAHQMPAEILSGSPSFELRKPQSGRVVSFQ